VSGDGSEPREETAASDDSLCRQIHRQTETQTERQRDREKERRREGMRQSDDIDLC